MSIKTLDINPALPLDGFENEPEKPVFRANWAEIKGKYESLAGQAWRDRGEWDDGTAYLAGDVVYEADAHYRSISDNTGQQPSESPSIWRLIAGAPVDFSGIELEDIGSDYGLAFDGVTDQTAAINDVMVTHPFAVFRAPSDATGPLRINGSFDPPNGADVDISRIDIDLGQLGRIFPQGQITETPDENPKIQLAADVAAGATTLFLNLVVAANIDELAVNKLLIVRGEKDASGTAMEQDRILIDGVTSTGALTATVTTQEPLRYGYDVEYPLSAHTPGDGTDKTRISVAVGSLLTASTDEGARVLTVADGSIFSPGDFAIVRSMRMVVPDDPNSIPYGEEPCRIFSVDGSTITLQESLGRAFATADKAGLYKQDEKRVRIKFGRGRIRAVEAPGSRRIDYIGGQYLTEGSEFVNPRIDTADEAHDHEGAGIALRRCYGVRVIDPFVRGRVNEGGGIGNGAFIAYSTRCVVVQGYFERCRHGLLFQGGNLNLWWRGAGVANYINAGDFHGAGEFNSRIEDCTFVGGTETAPDSTQQGGVTCGNTRWHAEGRRNRVSGCFFVGFNANSGDFGILVRPAQDGLDLKNNTIISCNRGIGVQHNDQAGPIFTRDVILQGITYRDVVSQIVLTGEAPAWAAGQTVLSATAIRPRYRINAGNLYKTEAGGTTGATPPTHGSGSASDGTLTWIYVTAEANRIAGFVNRDSAFGVGEIEGEQPPSVDVSPVAVEYKTRDSSAPQVLLDPGDRRITANGTVRVNHTFIAPTEATEVRLDDRAVRGSTFRVTVTNSDYPVDLHRTSHTLRLAPAGSKITVAGTAVSGFDTTNIAAGQAIQVFKEGLELGSDESTETVVELLPLLADGTTIDSIGTVGVNGSVTLSAAADEDSAGAVLAEVIVGERGEINGRTLPVQLWEGTHDIEVVAADPFLHLSVVGPGPDLQTLEALTDDFAITPARWGSTLLFTAAVAKTVTIPAGVPGAWAVIDNRGTADLAVDGTAASVVIDTKQGDGKTYDPTIPAGGKAVLTYYAALDAKLDGRLKETV